MKIYHIALAEFSRRKMFKQVVINVWAKPFVNEAFMQTVSKMKSLKATGFFEVLIIDPEYA